MEETPRAMPFTLNQAHMLANKLPGVCAPSRLLK